MIRRLHRHLREISYHSARRRPTRWTRLADRAFFAAPALALLTTAWLHFGSVNSAPRKPEILRLGTALDGTPDVRLIGDSGMPGWPPRAYGEIELVTEGLRSGFPLVSRVGDGPLRIEFARPLLGSPPAPLDDPAMRAAAGAVIEAQGSAELRDRWAGRQRSRTLWLGLAGNFSLWWLAYLATMLLALQAMRLAAWAAGELGRRRRIDRRRTGRCLACGYDVRAIPWSERCPECGALLE
ncbi:MAG TPA: hypothetical protein PKC43_08730 [Phycisphaerales bacterium]|nr:hypothetical protein [Phycisphaerales bacterium]HMP37520.1 hypothetical protein [Phycisphaerales bacterium]